MELTYDEYLIIAAGVALMQKELFRAGYESMNGDRDVSEAITLEDFDEQYKIMTGLYGKFDKAVSDFEEG